MSSLLKTMADSEDIYLEPSALAGAFGPIMLSKKLGSLPKGYHMIWATGGSMVPSDEMQKYYNQGVIASKEY
jgi:D-serine dehydratase